jgi:hypothetical protein
MIGVPTVATADETMDLGLNHQSSSDFDYVASDADDDVDDDLEEVVVVDNHPDDDDTNNNREDGTNNNNKIKKKRKEKATNNPVTILVTCREAYVNSGNHKAVLLAMGIGIGHCIDTNEEPYLSSNNRCSFMPTAKKLTLEIQRRAVSFGMSGKLLPKPTNWVNSKLMDWLLKHPIIATSEIDNVREQIMAFDIFFKPKERKMDWTRTIFAAVPCNDG